MLVYFKYNSFIMKYIQLTLIKKEYIALDICTVHQSTYFETGYNFKQKQR